jgi:hypothetical protein
MKFKAARPSKIRFVVDHIALVWVAVGSRIALEASCNVAERRWKAAAMARQTRRIRRGKAVAAAMARQT